MSELPEHEERAVRQYVNSQSPPGDQAGVIQKVRSRRVLGRVHDVYDVQCESTRWWVVTRPMNLYLQSDFPEADQALMFHIGLSAVVMEQSRSELDEDAEEHVSPAWRRYRQALEAMNNAAEAEDFQTVGIRCRDALIAFARAHTDSLWLGDVTDQPKAADFKGWGNIYAEHLAEGRLRSYLKTLVDRTWDLAVWLQHYNNATPVDADIVLDATAHLLSTFGRLIRRKEQGDPERCPRCDSYRLDQDVENDVHRQGFSTSTVCGACGWRSEEEFTPWADHFDADAVERYLASPGLGISDRLHPNNRSAET